MMPVLDYGFIAMAAAVIAVGGVLKGMSGFGLPMVALPIMANVVPASTALALLSVPIIVTNIAQVARWDVLVAMVPRFWRLYLAIAVGVVVGITVLMALSQQATDIVVGSAMIGSALVRLRLPDFALPPRLELTLQPVVGVFAGVLGGVSSMFGPPVIVFMNLLALTRDQFIVALSVAYLVGIVPLIGGLLVHDQIGGMELMLSCAALLPAFAGMAIGRFFGGAVSPRLFGRIIFVLLVVSGCRLLLRGIVG